MTIEERSAIYVYCFIPAGQELRPKAPGIDGETQVTTRELGPIAAVTSLLSLDELMGPGGEASTPDLDWVAPRAMRHEEVIEEVMETSPVLPLTFGVVFSSEQALAEAVFRRRERIAAFLEYTADKQEWAVKVYADPRAIRAYVEGTERFREGLERLPESPGARYLQEKRLRRELDRLAAEERSEMVERIQGELSKAAIEEKRLRPSPRELSSRPDDMILNAAFLEEEEQVAPFIERVRALAEEYEPRGLTIEASGPWPPYNFCPRLEVEAR